mmetsp:Transcript_35871/g.99137  ORF Transcript_35871/g.99137 Transcript_35871/m.99137 type:complete len:124 (+) Transcript_35871:144-515(+)
MVCVLWGFWGAPRRARARQVSTLSHKVKKIASAFPGRHAAAAHKHNRGALSGWHGIGLPGRAVWPVAATLNAAGARAALVERASSGVFSQARTHLKPSGRTPEVEAAASAQSAAGAPQAAGST